MEARTLVAVAIIVVVIAAASFILASRGGGQEATTTTGSPSTVTTTTTGTQAEATAWKPDGIISPGEYESEVELANGRMKLYLRVDGEYVYIGIAGETKGWVAIGIDPTYKMKDADMIIGWVADNGTVFVFDAYSTGATGPHPPDEKLGGTNDIVEYGGKEEDGWTIIEVKRKVDTGDEYDKPLPPGSEVKIIYAMSTVDSFRAIHDVVAGAATVSIPEG